MYKVIFNNNKIASCEPLNDYAIRLGSAYQYAHQKGQLIYALIPAETEHDALLLANRVIEEFTSHWFV